MIAEQIDPRAFKGTKLSDLPTREDVSQLVSDYQLMLVSVIKTILDRYERNGDYPFVDTKLSLLDGRDFEDSDEVRGKNTIFPWIQGRGLEALVLHEAWLRNCDDIEPKFCDDLCKRIKIMVADVLESMEQLRAKNGGRVFFMMDRSGQPVKIGAGGKLEPVKLAKDAPSNYSDLFYVKGMVAAADMLGKKALVSAACKWYDKIHRDLCDNTFESDQQLLCLTDRAVGQVKGRFSHGPRMIALGAAMRFLDITCDGKYHDYGVEYIGHILENYVNMTGDCDCSKRYDMWEFTNGDGQKYIEPDGALLSDPGHATEFAGLALKLLRISEQKGTIEKMDDEKLTDLQCSLVAVLLQNYANGMSPMGYGIVKSFDLVSRKPVSSNMPWWSLPETMRTAMEAARVVPGQKIPQMGEILIECSNAFIEHYVRPELHLMAYQTIDENAEPVDEIPATPDADPGYHTGLCIIDTLDLFADEVIAIREGARE